MSLGVQESPGLRERGGSDRDNEYELTVVAGDQGGLEGTLEVAVTVTDQNEGPEVTGTRTFTISENQELVGASYSGRDPEDPSLDITRWSVTGSDGGDFEINEAGELSFRNSPDYEKPADSNRDNEYVVTVRASDGRYYGTLDVVVTVSDENEAPEIASNSKTEISYRENGTSGLYTYRATDPEKNDITWSVRGTDGSIFSDQRDRCARLQESPGLRERGGLGPGQRVRGNGGGSGPGRTRGHVGSGGDGDRPERGAGGNGHHHVHDHGEPGARRGDYSGTDPEDPGAQITRWSVTGSDGGDFEINEAGELSFRNSPDYEKPADSNRDNEYVVTVRASDGRYYGTLEVVVTVGDENEAPEIASNSKTEISYRENGTSGLYTYRATDPEKGEINWSVRGTDGSKFSISETGVLGFRTPPTTRTRRIRTGTTSTW